jgi:hypothetical protein
MLGELTELSGELNLARGFACHTWILAEHLLFLRPMDYSPAWRCFSSANVRVS